MSDFPHGEDRGYQRGCRCGPCRAGHNETQKQRTKIRATKPAKQIPHGVNGFVNYACRCPVCTEANSAACRRRYRQRQRNHWQAAS